MKPSRLVAMNTCPVTTRVLHTYIYAVYLYREGATTCNGKELETLGVETHWTISALAHEFSETLRIEQQPAITAEWTRHQIKAEEVLEVVEEEEVLS